MRDPINDIPTNASEESKASGAKALSAGLHKIVGPIVVNLTKAKTAHLIPSIKRNSIVGDNQQPDKRYKKVS
jgi:hypothetical protein